MSMPRRRRCLQCGQALAEFLTLCLALLPMMAAIVVVARYQDILRATDMASRYAAFAATGQDARELPDLASVAREVSVLFFGPPSMPLNVLAMRSTRAGGGAGVRGSSLPGDASPDLRRSRGASRGADASHPFWVDRGGRALLGDTASTVSVVPAKGGTTALQALDGTVGSAGFAPVAQMMKLPQGGLYDVQVRVKVASGWAFPGSRHPDLIPPLTLTRDTAVLIADWHADTSQQVAQAVQADPAILPLRELKNLSARLDPRIHEVDAPGSLQGPRLGDLQAWNEFVPQDRKAGGT